MLDSRIRDICEAQGVEILFYRGSSSKIAGFPPRSNPDLIFINANPKRSDLPLGWTIAHELLHVAQKDSASGGKELGKQIEDLLTPEELADFHTVLGEHYGTDEFATELPAFLAGDAISGHSVFDLHALENAGAITHLITGFFDGLGKLNPSSLEAADDSELATLPDQDNSQEDSSSRPSQDIPTEDETSPSEGEGDQAASIRIVSDRGGFRVIDAKTGNEIGFKKSYEEAVALANEHGGTLEDGCDIYLYFKRGWDKDQQEAAQDKARMLDEGDTGVRRSIHRKKKEQTSFRKSEKLAANKDADHKIDLQLGGSASASNIWALDQSVNRSIGAQIQNRIRGLPDGTRINKVQIKHR